MKIVDYTTVHSMMAGDTRTVAHFGEFLGKKAEKLGLVATLYKDLSATYLTDSLMNIYFNEKKGGQFQPIDAMSFEWDIKVEYIKKVYIAEDVTGTVGANKTPFRIVLGEKYYEKGDTFVAEGRQQFMVVRSPKMLAPTKWEYYVTVVGNNLTETANTAYLRKGQYTRWRSNYFPELSERGYSKFKSNVEKHRNYICLHRNSASWSSQYAALENVYIQTGKGDAKGKDAEFYMLNGAEKDALDSLYYAKNQNLLFGKTNYTANGKCLDQDEVTGMDVPMGDGIITQVERYCDKLAYSNLTVNVFDEVIYTLIQKSQMSTGNKYVFICNDKMYQQVGRTLREYLKAYAQDGTYFFSSKGNREVSVGAHFNSYMIQGNEISFVVDRCLSHEYGNNGYGVMLDMTKDMNTGRPAISAFTLRGGEMIYGNLPGLGGMDGKTSGQIATSVMGSSYHLAAYSGVAVFNPYRAFILQESVA